MAEISNYEPTGGKKARAKKHSTRMDMTPMVDLAFLLLTFFMLTTTFGKPYRLEVNMPAPGPPTELPPSTVTLLVGENDRLCYYQGIFDPATSILHTTTYDHTGLRRTLMDLNQKLVDKISAIEADLANQLITDSMYHIRVNQAMKDHSNEGIPVIIKATDKARYENLVYVLDEMKICSIVNYSIVDMTKDEEQRMVLL